MPPQIAKLNTSYQLNLQPLTPVHVGSGQLWKKNLDFFYYPKEQTVYLLDQDKLFAALFAVGGRNEIDRYCSYLAAGKLDDLSTYLKSKVDIPELAFWNFGYDAAMGNVQEIRALVRTGFGTPYLPGSSIKGALRSLIFNYLYKQIIGSGNQNKRIITDLLGDFDRSIMHYIMPYDVEMTQTEISDIDLFNLYNKGRDWESKLKPNFRILAETFAPTKDNTATFRLDLPNEWLNILEKEEKRLNVKILPSYLRQVIKTQDPITHLFGIINNYTHEHIQREIAFFEKYYQAKDTSSVVEKLYELKKLTQQSPNQCVLRMSYGSGFHGMTGDWRFTNHIDTIYKPDQENKIFNFATRQREPARYKSRRIAYNGAMFAPMGFVLLTHTPK